MNRPLITVFMAVYNGSKYIKQAIESILEQSYTNFELLIVNDGSTDDSLDIINKYADRRIRLLDNGGNKGLIFTRNRGITEAKGELISILDCDDIAVPDRLTIQYDFFLKNPDVALCGGRALFINEDNNVVGESNTYRGDSNVNLIFSNILINSAVMLKTKVAKEMNLYQRHDFGEDYDLALRISERYRVAAIDDILVKYRVHVNSTSVVKADQMAYSEKMIFKSFHHRIGLPTNQQRVQLHHSYISGNYASFTLNDYLSFFIDLKNNATLRKHYNFEELERLIYKKWFEIVMLKGGKKAFFLLFKKGLYKISLITFKQLRRAFKKSVKESF